MARFRSPRGLALAPLLAWFSLVGRRRRLTAGAVLSWLLQIRSDGSTFIVRSSQRAAALPLQPHLHWLPGVPAHSQLRSETL